MTKDWMILDFDNNSNIKSLPESNILIEDLESGLKKTFHLLPKNQIIKFLY